MVEPPPCRLHHRDEDGRRLPFLVWAFPEPWRVVSSAAVGGGIGDRCWITNAQVAPDYDRVDLAAHVAALARAAGLDPLDGPDPDPDPDPGAGAGAGAGAARGRGPAGVGLLTAADVSHADDVHDRGVTVRASVGIRLPVLAGTAPDRRRVPAAPGTINLIVLLPRALSDAALVNVATTVTEAKTQALLDAGVAGTGTASDALAVACPAATTAGAAGPDPFGGPLSTWGGPAARATYAAVLEGVAHSRAVMGGTR